MTSAPGAPAQGDVPSPAGSADTYPWLSVILPAYNEEENLSRVLTQVTAAFPQAEVILVSDGSTDGTPTIAARFAPDVSCIHYSPNHGKGYAVRTGMLAAKGEILVFTDADLPFGTTGVRAVAERLRQDSELDIVIASKTGIKRGLAYRTARHVARAGIALLTGLRYPDTQAGLKGFRAPAAKAIYSRTRIDGFASDIEVLYLAERDGLRVAAIPMTVADDFVRPSTFGLRQGWRLLKDVGRIRLGRQTARAR